MKKSFVWDAAKAASNLRKHGVSFETAARVFTDPFAITSADRIEDGELRWLTTGVVEVTKVIVVAHTFREMDDNGEEVDIVRIISARRADRSERRRYEEDAREI